MLSCHLHFLPVSNSVLDLGYTATWCLSVAVVLRMYFFFFNGMQNNVINDEISIGVNVAWRSAPFIKLANTVNS